MKPKYFISLFCLVVLMFQLLPVKQLGCLLFTNQLQEELPHTADDVEKDMKGNVDFRKDFLSVNGYAQAAADTMNAICYIHFAIALPLPHASEIHTPPPNHC